MLRLRELIKTVVEAGYLPEFRLIEQPPLRQANYNLAEVFGQPKPQGKKPNMTMFNHFPDNSISSGRTFVAQIHPSFLPLPNITFFAEDLPGQATTSDQSVVICADIGEFHLHRILIDTGSFVDILCMDTFRKMGFPNCAPTHGSHSGDFASDAYRPIRQITLPVSRKGLQDYHSNDELHYHRRCFQVQCYFWQTNRLF
ncbi:hypothetical protein AXF42_Ash001410 [Apostasia shenzhenica]|uniref:Uncharacterized protein n=1 Tax=Apostasia shenzhenica TaxID=1088818 RepID=A0A2I0AUY9_9ASPA|nr:hypothetical protein AXF42_Ash001410 [Apostasia shenzhenica]